MTMRKLWPGYETSERMISEAERFWVRTRPRGGNSPRSGQRKEWRDLGVRWVVAKREQSQDDDGIQGRGAIYEPDANIQRTRESDWITSLMMTMMNLRAPT